ncbi:MAG: hypothetical protein ABFD50_05170 [Smithella sp.]
MEKEIMLTGRGVALVTFLTDEKDAGKVQYYKMLFLQMAKRTAIDETEAVKFSLY